MGEGGGGAGGVRDGVGSPDSEVSYGSVNSGGM